MTVSRRTLARLALVPAVLLSTLACGTATVGPAARVDAGGSEGPSSTDADPEGDTWVGCFGQSPGWAVSAMDGGIEPVDRDALAGALEELAADAGIDAPAALRSGDLADADWFVLDQSPTDATVATGAWDANGPAPDGQVVTLRREGEQWRASGWGDCRIVAPVPEPGRQRVEVRAARELDPTSTTLSLRLREGGCTGARDPRPHLGTPEVVETDESVTITWTSAAIDGAATCQANPWVPGTVELAAPLGDRVLLDASRWPAHPIANAG
ncbi:hypothetical protein [Nocardioides sp. zg-DK7169]|uniref:hypothetical protein n=1 Tax=Nocardioides sp. zg-DK7169 TaxID=2736600 RepID=UPI0015529798|nr:hypothetical protein [Nocardioides sp. zg-DK7169]NPC98108.1 hypothetical protein [Nocardioides sp. zg-DK7169]